MPYLLGSIIKALGIENKYMSNFNSVLYQLLGAKLKARRDELRINQNDLGEKVGIGRTSISNIEQGRQKPPLSVIYKICHELNIDVHSALPTYSQIDEVINLNNDSSLKLYYDKYGLDENTQREIDDLFKDKTNDI